MMEKTRYALCLLAGISSLFAIAPRSLGSTEVQEVKKNPGLRGKVVRSLRHSEFVKNISCAQFADLMLGRLGLPLIGRDEPVFGTRGDMNRRGERELLPQFEDSVSRTTKPHAMYAVEAKTDPSWPKDSWRLKITRIPGGEDPDGKSATAVSEFYFQVGTADSAPSCDLLYLYYQSPEKAMSGRYDASRCIDLFMPGNQTGADVFGAILKRDCSLALHYFLSMKNR
jgi:hypothetical protein